MSVHAIRQSPGVSGIVPNWYGNLTHVIPGGSTNADITINTNGSISYGHGTGDTAWYRLGVGSPGNSYWAKFTVSGWAWNAGLTPGSLYALSSGRSVAWSASSGSGKTATLTVSIYSDAGGANLVGTGIVNVLLDGAP